jgi:3-oxoacyl-[acyl-carrier protein] reductase
VRVLLEGKNAVVYGGSGRVGGAVAKAFAGEGATVVVAGRTRDGLERVAGEIAASGGRAQVAEVDALDEAAVNDQADGMVQQLGSIDVSFNAIAQEAVHGTPLLDLPYEDFARSMDGAVHSLFLTARAAARHMTKQGSGVIMTITATTSRMSIPNVGGTAVAFDAAESLCRQWAAELGPHGVRVLWLLTTGIPEAIAMYDGLFPDYGAWAPPLHRQELIELMERKTLLGRLTTLAEVGNTAAFLASDQASALTGTSVNLTCGAVTR